MKEIDGDKLFNLRDSGQEHPSRGSLLVAKPQLTDACFERSVVVMIGNDDSGAMGLVVNRVTGFMLHDVLPELGEVATEVPLYMGGPVAVNTMFYLHTLAPDVIPGSIDIGGSLRMGGDYEAMKRYVASGAPTDSVVKFIVGYSGWSAHQLDREIEEQSWAVLKGSDPALVMADEVTDIWPRAVAAFGDRYRLWLTMPLNPRLN